MPTVSVLMPIYRTEPAYLKQAIASVLAQTFSDFELLILDDCPTDDREAVVASFRDKRIKYLKNKTNLGISPSRNRLIDMAKGKYLAVMDHDDIALPDRFEKQVKVLASDPKIGVVGCWVERFPAKKMIRYPEYNADIEGYLMQGCAVPHTGAMIRKSALGSVRYEQDFSPSEDYALWVRLFKKTRFYNVPEVLMKYRWYDGNTSRRKAGEMAVAKKKIQNVIRSAYPDIWRDVCEKAPHLVRMKLFGLIPCGRFVQTGNGRKGILKYLPFIKTNTKLKV